MKIKLAVLWAGLLILVLWVSACTPQASITASATMAPTSTQSTPAGQPGIDDQWQQALQTADTQLQQSLQGSALQQAEQSLQTWVDVNQKEIEFQKTNGEVSTNPQGKLIFMNQSAVWFANLLADLELSTAAEIKWMNYQERAPAQRAAAVEVVQSYAGQNAEVTYLKTEHFIYDPMRMVEEYLAAGYDYRVDVETGLIVEIDPVQDASFSAIKAGTEDREAGRQQAEAIIQRLDPTVKLDSLSYAENVDPGYYRWEDRSADLLPSGQYRSLQVVFATDETFFSYVNTLTATP